MNRLGGLHLVSGPPSWYPPSTTKTPRIESPPSTASASSPSKNSIESAFRLHSALVPNIVGPTFRWVPLLFFGLTLSMLNNSCVPVFLHSIPPVVRDPERAHPRLLVPRVAVLSDQGIFLDAQRNPRGHPLRSVSHRSHLRVSELPPSKPSPRCVLSGPVRCALVLVLCFLAPVPIESH